MVNKLYSPPPNIAVYVARIINVLGASLRHKPPIPWFLEINKTGVATEVRPDLTWSTTDPRDTKNNPTMVYAFPLASRIAQIEILRRISQGHIGSLHVNSIHPLNVRILQVLMEIMTWFYVGKVVGFMVGGGMNCRCWAITTAEHPTLLSSAPNKIRIVT